MPKSQWHILQLSDTHFLENADDKLYDLNTHHTFSSVIDKIKQSTLKPDYILLTGDLSHDGSKASYQRLANFIDELKIPTFYLPGNHDVQPNIHDYLPSQFIQNKTLVEIGSWRILLLDSTIPNETPGYISTAQLQSLENTLAKMADNSVLIAIHHHLLFDEHFENTYEIKNSAAFFDILDKFKNVKAVIYGHVHQIIEIKRNRVHYLSCPSTAKQFKWDLAANKIEMDELLSPGWRWLTLYEDGSFESRVEWVS